MAGKKKEKPRNEKQGNGKLGVVDTTFSRVDMGAAVMAELANDYPELEVVRRTVPGIKDIAVECKRLLEEEKCGACLALGYVGGAQIDKQCAHEASSAIMQAKLATNRHILEAFIFENEAWNAKELEGMAIDRALKHAHNAVALITSPKLLTQNAGMGLRQGKGHEGSAREKEIITISIAVARFNDELTSRMEKSAVKEAKRLGCRIGKIMHVPGSFELPLAVKKLLGGKDNDAVLALGAIVKGDTKHDEIIGFAIAKRLSELSLEYRKPAILGIIGPGATWEQANARAEEYGKHAVESAVLMAKELKK